MFEAALYAKPMVPLICEQISIAAKATVIHYTHKLQQALYPPVLRVLATTAVCQDGRASSRCLPATCSKLAKTPCF